MLMIIMCGINFVAYYCVFTIDQSKLKTPKSPDTADVSANAIPNDDLDELDATILVIRGCHCCNFSFDTEFDNGNNKNYVEIDLEMQPLKRTTKQPKSSSSKSSSVSKPTECLN